MHSSSFVLSISVRRRQEYTFQRLNKPLYYFNVLSNRFVFFLCHKQQACKLRLDLLLQINMTLHIIYQATFLFNLFTNLFTICNSVFCRFWFNKFYYFLVGAKASGSLPLFCTIFIENHYQVLCPANIDRFCTRYSS